MLFKKALCYRLIISSICLCLIIMKRNGWPIKEVWKHKFNDRWWCKEPDSLRNPIVKRQIVNGDYDGWKHPFWTPEKSLNISDYIDVNNLVSFSFEDCSDLRWNSINQAFIFLHSNPNPGGEMAREVIRKTWMTWTKSSQYSMVKVVFVIGLQDNITQQETLLMEQLNHCDMVQFNFRDSYYNSTLKYASTLRYLYTFSWDKYRGPPDFIIKGDDDVFVNVPNLMDIIKKWENKSNSLEESCEKKNIPIIGQLSKPGVLNYIRGEFIPDKWRVPAYMLDEEIPQYVSGGLQLIPKWSLPCLVTAIWKSHLVSSDDLYITGFIARACHVLRRRIDNGSFYPKIAIHIENHDINKQYELFEQYSTKDFR